MKRRLPARCISWLRLPWSTLTWLGLLGLGLAPIVASTSLAAAQAPASEARDAEAHSLFEAGRTAYSEGRFEAALGHFRQSHELSQRPQLLYNIGQCLDRLRRDVDAVDAFEQFLAQVPDAPQQAEVTARVEILRAAIQRADASTAVDATTADTTTTTPTVIDPPAPVASSGPGPAPWIVLGAGVAVVIVGAILLGVGYASIATVDGAMNVPFASVRGAYADAPVFTGAGWGVLAAGVALAGVGLVWGLTSGGGSGSEHARLHLGPTGIALSGSF